MERWIEHRRSNISNASVRSKKKAKELLHDEKKKLSQGSSSNPALFLYLEIPANIDAGRLDGLRRSACPSI